MRESEVRLRERRDGRTQFSERFEGSVGVRCRRGEGLCEGTQRQAVARWV